MGLAKLVKTNFVNSNDRKPHLRVWLSILILLLTPITSYAQSKQVRFEIRNTAGERLSLATVISKSNNFIISLDSSASALAAIGDTLEIRHVGYATLKGIVYKANQLFELSEVSYSITSIEVTSLANQAFFIGVKPNRRKLNPVYWGNIHEVVLPIVNTTRSNIRLDRANFTIINEGLINGVIQHYPSYEFRLYRDSLTSEHRLENQITIRHHGEGLSTQSISLDSFNLVLKPGQKVFIGLKAYTLTGGFYHTKLKRDVSMERLKNLEHTRRWGSWLSYRVLKEEAVYFMRNEFGRNKNAWVEHRDKTVPAFYVTYQVVTE